MPFQRFYNSEQDRFNMTPVIDIVFLLIIFFMIVCQFIVAENFEVDVPDDISSGQRAEEQDQKSTTVTVMLSDVGEVSYAVGSEIIGFSGEGLIDEEIAAAIDRQLENLSEQKRVVGLRVDKEVLFKDSRYALAGIGLSSATDIKLSVIKQKISR